MHVAAEVGPSVRDVAEQPFALTLWTYAQLQERRRMFSLLDQQRAVEQANLAALAFHEPKSLARVQEELDAEIRRPADGAATEAARRRGESIARRIARGRRHQVTDHG